MLFTTDYFQALDNSLFTAGTLFFLPLFLSLLVGSFFLLNTSL